MANYSSKHYSVVSSIFAEGTDEQVQALGGTHSAKQWAVLSSLSMPGAIIMWAGPAANVDTAHWYICDGSAKSRTEDAELFEAIGTTWGSGDGSTTFNIPKLNDNRFPEGSSSAGSYKDAGLPSIAHTHTAALKGTYDNVGGQSNIFAGSDYDYSKGTGTTDTNSAVSDIFGKSDTVQPKSATVLFLIRR